jgi:uncharacterized RDD family membrane protein YckC
MSAGASPADMVSYQSHYAGAVSRFAAYAIDVAVSTVAFSLGLAAISYGVKIVTGHQVNWNNSDAVVAVIFALWQFVYFAYSWAVSGRTPGMALLGLLVVRADGTTLDPLHAILRALVFPLNFLLAGLPFLVILVQRERRGVADLIADTAVIYSWDARAARLRFLARQAELTADEGAPSHLALRPASPLEDESRRGPAPGTVTASLPPR